MSENASCVRLDNQFAVLEESFSLVAIENIISGHRRDLVWIDPPTLNAKIKKGRLQSM
jgi:hypothetical protein